MRFSKEMLKIGSACTLAGLLLAELTCGRGSFVYFVVLVGGTALLTSVVAMVLRNWFVKIDEAKQALQLQEAAYKALPLEQAKLSTEGLLRTGGRFRIGQGSHHVPWLKTVGGSTEEFFAKIPSLVDIKGELMLEARPKAERKLRAIGDVLVIGEDGGHTLIVVRPNSDEVIEVFEPDSDTQECCPHPSIYHFLARYASLH